VSVRPREPRGRGGATAEQLRSDIDHGRMGDKVDVADPAAAPLGTDDEAAGTPPSPHAVSVARAGERGRTLAVPQRRRGPSRAWILPAFVLALIGALVVWALVQL
jgi:hypothetical protein